MKIEPEPAKSFSFKTFFCHMVKKDIMIILVRRGCRVLLRVPSLLILLPKEKRTGGKKNWK